MKHSLFARWLAVMIGLAWLSPGLAVADRVAKPVFSVPSGRYHHPLTVTISCATPGATITYTLDGTVPGDTSLVYDGSPILVANHASGDSLTGATDNDPDPADSVAIMTLASLTLRAVANKPGMEPSAVATAVYVVDLVEASFNIPYADPPPAGGGKHLLDVYQPAGKRNTPVLFFVHGGAWKTGDKSLYMELGNTFAGYYNVTTVVANYQLSADPWNARHPTHVQDVAMAFHWVVDHIAEYGGDPGNISVFGQSAGGHLLSLLATDTTYLAAQGVNEAAIKRVISMSGAYDLPDLVQWPMNPLGLNAQDVLLYKALCENAFGTWDEDVLAAASPIDHVHTGQPPFFLITLQEAEDFKDMPGFVREAEDFAARVLAEGQAVHLDYLRPEDIPPEIRALDFPSDADGHYHEIYAINTRYWDSPSARMVASCLDLQPERPELTEPPDHARIVADSVRFRWTSTTLATYYRLQVSNSVPFDSTRLLFDGRIGDTTWTLVSSLTAGQYSWRVSGVNGAGASGFSEIRQFEVGTAVGVHNAQAVQPNRWHLDAYPNPFNTGVRFHLQNPHMAGSGRLTVFDVTGRKVFQKSVLVRAGENSFLWQPEQHLTSGVYLVQLRLPGVVLHKRVVLLK